MLTPFGETGIINNPALDLTQMEHGRQSILSNRTQQRTITPGRGRDEVMQRLMFGTDMTGIKSCCHRLDAFALAGQKQAREVTTQRLDAVGMIEFVAQQIQVVLKTLFMVFQRREGNFSSPHIIEFPKKLKDFVTQYY
jgi:hypothetical protein